MIDRDRGVAWSVGLCVCWSRSWALQKKPCEGADSWHHVVYGGQGRTNPFAAVRGENTALWPLIIVITINSAVRSKNVWEREDIVESAVLITATAPALHLLLMSNEWLKRHWCITFFLLLSVEDSLLYTDGKALYANFRCKCYPCRAKTSKSCPDWVI